MTFYPFDLERWQSTWENRVRHNLSESGVHPLTVRELLEIAGASADPLLDVLLCYSQSNGTDLLRQRIAALYPGATPEHVLVTSGSSEANFCACWGLIRPGDKVTVLVPNYMQTNGLARNFGATVNELTLRPELGWEPDPADIPRAIPEGTRLVVVTNPHNPTSHILSAETRDAILKRVAEVGAWLLADEVYTGAEHDGHVTPSHWGRYERVVIVNGLSKAYGLPGLRVGWIVSTPQVVAQAWERHDYTTIGPSGTVDHLAALALAPGTREKILARTRGILNKNWPVLEKWLRGFGETFYWRAPQAGAICYARYSPKVSGLKLIEQLRADHDVLLVAGEQFGAPGFIRFGLGSDTPALQAALAETARGLKKVFGD